MDNDESDSDDGNSLDEVFGITKISLSHDRMLVASVTLDDAVKLIDISNLKQR